MKPTTTVGDDRNAFKNPEARFDAVFRKPEWLDPVLVVGWLASFWIAQQTTVSLKVLFWGVAAFLLSASFIHEHLHQLAYLLLTGEKGTIQRFLKIVPITFLPDSELPAPVFRTITAAPLLWVAPLGMTATISVFFGLPERLTDFLSVICLLYPWSIGRDVYWIVKLRAYNHEWLVSDQGDYLVLRFRK